MNKWFLMITFFLAGSLLVSCGDDESGTGDGSTDQQDLSDLGSQEDPAPDDLIEEVTEDTQEDVTEPEVQDEEPSLDDIPSEVSIQPELWTIGEVIDTCGNGLLAELDMGYGRILIARLEGDDLEMAYQYGCLLGQYIVDMWWQYMEMAAQYDDIMNSAEDADVLAGYAMDLLWEHFDPYVPQQYKDEFAAISRGAADRGIDCNCTAHEGVGQIVQRAYTILEASQTNAYSEGMQAFIRFINRGGSDAFFHYYEEQDKMACLLPVVPESRERIPHPEEERRVPSPSCSTFAIWGDQTEDNHLFASRVLDFGTDSGIADYALITVYVPDEGAAYATIGYAAVPQAGISVNGLAVGMVGSRNTIERIDSASGLIKMREALQWSSDIHDAMSYMANQVEDGFNRPNSIGASVVVAWGDPAGNGALAQAVAMELNGAMSTVFPNGPYPDCGADAELILFDIEGLWEGTMTNAEHPNLVNLEADTYEIDRFGQIRTFQVDEDGDFIRVNNQYVDDPEGLPMLIGRPLPCAVFRGDEAMGYAVRRWQTASNGPMNDHGRLMVDAGSYRNRYMVMHNMIEAFRTGDEFTHDGQVVIPDNQGVQRLIGFEEAQMIASEAAMNENILCVVYDATGLQFSVAYESGRGESWVPGSANPYTHFDLLEMVYPW